ncbi:MAG: carbamoyltransferase HypF [Thermoprotei archaeon]|nr:MAG: carbamoyltransferase HypF [Thermoprotei archaeon]
MLEAARIRVTGIVQGVGFRPFVYRLAKNCSLKGYVQNLGGSEVEIWVEGEKKSIISFIEKLKNEKPRAAELDKIEIEWVKPWGFADFEIKRSGTVKTKLSMIPPDFGMCDDCLREVLDPTSRWYRYPFHSCAWCGPRFTVIEHTPYDRENTSMKFFPLCEDCRKEYSDPGFIRRFHIQGISCPQCGPQLYLTDRNGAPIRCRDPISEAAKLIDEGYIVAVKGLGGFHLAALATDDDVVKELRRRKKRSRKPFAIMALDLNVARKIVYVTEEAEDLLTSSARPIVVLPRKSYEVSKEVAPGLDTLGVILAYTPLHYLLLNETRDKFLIMTSGNISGYPISKDLDDALKKLGDIADFFLTHNRRIVNRADDSVVRFTDGTPMFLRRSRGYAPRWIEVWRKLERPAIAVGAMLNDAGAIGVEQYIIPTQYIGDVENIETLDYLREAIDFLIKNYGIDICESKIIADKHPNYLSLILARELASKCGSDVYRVQHHVAHIASVMAENDLKEAYGIAIDGIGYGDDGMIWGGEVLYIGEDGSYERLGHLEYIPMPGGDRATKYPARIVAGILYEIYGMDEALRISRKYRLSDKLPGGNVELKIALHQASNNLKTSSIGRVLDAFSALLGVCWERSYEGEPAIRLEAAGLGGNHLGLTIEWEDGVVQTKEFFLSLLERGFDGLSLRDIAYTVQYELARGLGIVAKEEGAKKVLVSGGAAVNTIIIKSLREIFGKKNVVLPQRLPASDGGISTGQIYYAMLSGEI